jgi:hypothetical protein
MRCVVSPKNDKKTKDKSAAGKIEGGVSEGTSATTAALPPIPHLSRHRPVAPQQHTNVIYFFVSVVAWDAGCGKTQGRIQENLGRT